MTTGRINQITTLSSKSRTFDGTRFVSLFFPHNNSRACRNSSFPRLRSLLCHNFVLSRSDTAVRQVPCARQPTSIPGGTTICTPEPGTESFCCNQQRPTFSSTDATTGNLRTTTTFKVRQKENFFLTLNFSTNRLLHCNPQIAN